jgi:hypothetical protein
MGDQEELSRAEAIAKRAMELSSRAEELARQAHEVAGVDEQLAALEAELEALSAEEATLDAGIEAGAEAAAGHGASGAQSDGPSSRMGEPAHGASGSERLGPDASGSDATDPIDGGEFGPGSEDWFGWAETFSARMEALGDRIGELVSGHIDAALGSTAGRVATPSGRRAAAGDIEVEVGGALDVRVMSRGGGVEVRPGPANQVRVHWSSRGLFGLLAGEEPVLVTQRDGAVFVETPGRTGWRSSGIHLDIEVPVGSAVDLSTGGGSVEVSGVNGPARARTGGGSIRLSDVDGEVQANTGGGSIHFEGRPAGQSLLRTGGGSVEAVLAPGTVIDIEARGTNAVIDVAGSRVHGSHVTGSVGGGGTGLLQIRTGGGTARVRQG